MLRKIFWRLLSFISVQPFVAKLFYQLYVVDMSPPNCFSITLFWFLRLHFLVGCYNEINILHFLDRTYKVRFISFSFTAKNLCWFSPYTKRSWEEKECGILQLQSRILICYIGVERHLLWNLSTLEKKRKNMSDSLSLNFNFIHQSFDIK